MVKDPWKVLGVSETAGADEIKRAYRKLAKENHPDLHPNDPGANRRMQEINEAYDLLTRPGGYQKQAARDAYRPYGAGNAYQRPYGAGQRQYTWYTAQRNAYERRPVTVVNPFRLVLRFVGILLLARLFINLFGFGFFWLFI